MGYFWYCLICVDGELVGVIYLIFNKGVYCVCGDVSYIFVKEYWGKGVMIEVNVFVVKVGFIEFGFYCI